MKLGEVIYEPGGELCHVYFPTNCIVSLLYVMENGASAEIAVVGNDGIVGGVAVFMGGGTMPQIGPWCKVQGRRIDCAASYRCRHSINMGRYIICYCVIPRR